MSAVLQRRLPWLVAGLAIGMMMLGISFTLAYVLETGDAQLILSHQASIPLATLAYAVMGRLIVARHPRSVIGWLFLVTAILMGLTAFAVGFSAFASLDPSSWSVLGAWANWLDRWVWLPGSLLPLVFVLLVFPDGRLLSRRWIPFGWSAALGLGGAVLSLALYPGPIESWDISGPNPIGIPGAGPLLEAILTVSTGLVVLSIIAALVSVGLRFRRSRGRERAQMKWVVYAAGMLLVEGILGWAVAPLVLGEAAAYEVGLLSEGLGILGIAGAVTVAILRHRLYDIDVVINRTLVYGALSATVVAVYLLVAGGLGALLQTQGSLALSLLGVGMVAVVVQPMRDRLQHGVNRLLYGERDDPYAVLSRLGQRLEATFAPEAVLPTIVETVAQALKLPYAAITLRRLGADTFVAEHGRAAGEPVRLPLVYQGETVGQLILSPRAPGEAFSPADRRLLDDLARQAGVAAHAVGLTIALQRSRERLVTAREEERRRLRRDLHDGLGAQLAGITLKLETARNRLPNDPVAQALLADLTAQTQAAVGDIRRLVYGLRPPALDELGLAHAVRQAAANYAPADVKGLHIRVEAPDDLPPLPAAVEVAAYRIAQEALTNVVRHAGAHDCVVCLALDQAAARLCLEVRDDGRGLPAARRAGVGLSSMRERAEELGGTFTIEALPLGGTRLTAQLPCRAAQTASVPEPAT